MIVGISDGRLARVSLQIYSGEVINTNNFTVVIAHMSGNSRLVSVTDVVPSSIVNPVLEISATQCSTDEYFSLLRDP